MITIPQPSPNLGASKYSVVERDVRIRFFAKENSAPPKHSAKKTRKIASVQILYGGSIQNLMNRRYCKFHQSVKRTPINSAPSFALSSRTENSGVVISFLLPPSR